MQDHVWEENCQTECALAIASKRERGCLKRPSTYRVHRACSPPWKMEPATNHHAAHLGRIRGKRTFSTSLLLRPKMKLKEVALVFSEVQSVDENCDGS